MVVNESSKKVCMHFPLKQIYERSRREAKSLVKQARERERVASKDLRAFRFGHFICILHS